MLTRGLVETIIDDYHARVRIPRTNKLASSVGGTPSDELSIATICTIPGCSPKLRRNDVVFVDYQDDDSGTPVILGVLFNSNNTGTYSDIVADSLKVNVNTTLPQNTNIGKVTANSLKNLEGLTANVQLSIDQNNSEHLNFQNNLNSLNLILSELQDTSELDNRLNLIESKNSLQDSNLNNLNNTVNNINSKLNGPLILNRESYGTSPPSSINNPREGQIYLYIK